MNKVLTIPNLLSGLRLLLIAPLIYCIVHVSDRSFLFVVFFYLFTVLLDFLDGFFARRLHQESDVGRILDPLADKALVLAILVTLVFRTDFPLLLAVLIILRDFLILLASIILFRGRHIIKPSLFVGKVAFGIISMLIFIYILDLHEAIDLAVLKQFLIVLSFAFLVWSWVEYYKVYEREKDVRKQTDPDR